MTRKTSHTIVCDLGSQTNLLLSKLFLVTVFGTTIACNSCSFSTLAIDINYRTKPTEVQVGIKLRIDLRFIQTRSIKGRKSQSDGFANAKEQKRHKNAFTRKAWREQAVTMTEKPRAWEAFSQKPRGA